MADSEAKQALFGGVEMTKPSAMAWLFDGGLVRRLEFHLDRDAALGAGGFA